EVGGAQAAGAGHVLRNDRRIARDVPAQMARDHARISIVAATGAIADDEGDVPAAEEFAERMALGARGRQEEGEERQSEAGAHGGPRWNTRSRAHPGATRAEYGRPMTSPDCSST